MVGSAFGVPVPSDPPPGVALLSAGAAWEVGLVPLLEQRGLGAYLVRRCVDLADLLAVAAAGAVRVAVVDAERVRVDRETVAQLHALGVALLAVATPERAAALLGLGVADVAAGSEPPSALLARARTLGQRVARVPPSAPAPARGSGRMTVVWGPSGAPGRSTVAVGLASELARRGRQVLLVDADAAGGAVGTLLGILDEAPGVAAAARAALRGRLDPDTLLAASVTVEPGLAVLTGSSRPDRWRELRPVALQSLWDVARHVADDVVVDVSGGAHDLGVDPALDPAGVDPGAAARSALAAAHPGADDVLAVAAADPVGLLRLVHALDVLDDLGDAPAPSIVVNRVRASVLGSRPRRQIQQALGRFAGREPIAFLPDDPRAADAAARVGRPLAEVAATSSLRRALVELAATLRPEADLARVRRHSRRSLRSAG